MPHLPPIPPQQERPLKCDQRPQSFNRNHDLKRHKRVHITVKPLSCHNCDNSFSQKDALKRHRLVKGCGEKVRDPGPSNIDKSRPARESRVESPDADVSINTTSGFSFRDGPLSINQDVRSGTNIKMETPESP
ncbi:hypothetical protein B0T26DRAFT_769531 [Lasiosphaeria miniovina]|uniref:C2H2-type domain-containing protein n=1 Tax=Lasiosphaeria miniovina TaxID=1954250 RepID=A0AA40ATM2_9PEZI|nr:uncharacterized protein B0T26DRAFT_769531 [Lasiosphaeria miniovina]KAK0721802.1 hypothetical protein B0T26DRAFT_769531 [Lasiosphaeria miniovina]